MKLHIVYDGQGKIAAINTLLPAAGAGVPSPQYGVEVRGGQRAADIEVPAAYREWSLADIAARLQVQTSGSGPVLVTGG